MILRSHYFLKRESKNIYYFFKFFILAKLRNVSGYKSIFKQQLESIFIMPSTPTPNLRLAPRPNKYMPLLALRPEYVCLNISQAVKKNIHLSIPQDLKHFCLFTYPLTTNQKRFQVSLMKSLANTK